MVDMGPPITTPKPKMTHGYDRSARGDRRPNDAQTYDQASHEIPGEVEVRDDDWEVVRREVEGIDLQGPHQHSYREQVHHDLSSRFDRGFVVGHV